MSWASRLNKTTTTTVYYQINVKVFVLQKVFVLLSKVQDIDGRFLQELPQGQSLPQLNSLKMPADVGLQT